MRLLTLAFVTAGLAGALALGGCGLKGALYLPEKTGNVVVRPAPGAAQPSAEPAPPAEGQPASAPPPETDVEPEVAPPGDSGG